MSQQRYSRPAYKDFTHALECAANSGHTSHWNLFGDFLELSFLAMSQAATKILTGEIDAKREARYMEIVKRYPNPKAFSEAHAILVNGLQDEIHDFLGNLAGELGLLEGEWHGQFFTPQPICDFMAQLTLGDVKPDPHHRLTIQEPAVGAGAMVLAAASHLHSRGFHPCDWWVDAADKDRRMFHAAYVQLTLCGVPGVVRHMDSISQEQWDYAVTLTGAMFPYRRPRVTEDPLPSPSVQRSTLESKGQFIMDLEPTPAQKVVDAVTNIC